LEAIIQINGSLWPDSEVPTTGPAGPLTEIDLKWVARLMLTDAVEKVLD